MSAKSIWLFLGLGASVFLTGARQSGAQQVRFDNAVLIPYVTDGDVLVRDSQGAPLTGTNFVAQLYYGTSATALVADTAAPARFRPPTTSQPGTWVGENRTLTGLSVGSLAVLAVRVWDINLAPTYEQALALGAPTHDCGPFYYQVRLSGAATNFYMFEFRARNGLSGCSGSGVPTFQTQPQSQTVASGDTLTLSSMVLNACLYQWWFNGQIVGFRPTLVISNVQSSHAGSYQLIAGNYSGSVTSQPVSVTVAQPASVLFANNVLPNPPDRLVRWFDGSGLTGTNYVAQLYYGLTSSSLTPLTNPPAPFRVHTTAFPGTWNGGTRRLPGISPGTPVFLQVKVWDSRFAATFEEAFAQGRFALPFQPFSYTPPVNPLMPDELYMMNFNSSIWLSCPMFPTPIIHVHPASQTVLRGTNVQLRVVAEYPCHTEWFFNGVAITVTYPSSTLTISNIQPANVGDYYARVMNFNGSAAATSQVARITLVGQPRLSSMAHSGGLFTFELPSTANETFVIETTTNLGPAAIWTPIHTNTAPFWFTNSIGADRQRFFRTVFR
jgi:hypothetical protein